MIIPYATNAPIYHYPISTVGIIVANIAIFVGLAVNGLSHEDPGLARDLCLTFGISFRPWQWVTSNFMHADIVHLLGNMLNLWGFGIVVEGKIGWGRFLAIYLVMGIVYCLIQQVLMVFADEGYSLGASGVIFAIMAIAMIWSPQNEMSCVTFFFYRPFFFDVSVLTLVAMMITLQVLTQVWIGAAMSSQALHIIGAIVGGGVGFVMLKKRWVDCEGWDLFSVYTGKPSDADREKDEDEQAVKKLLDQAHRKQVSGREAAESLPPTMPAPTRQSPQPPAMPIAPAQPLVSAQEQLSFDDLVAPLPGDEADLQGIKDAIASGDPDGAFAAYEEYASEPLNWPLPERELTQIVALYHKQKKWRPSVPAMVRYLEHFTDKEAAIRLKLAHVLIDVERRPRQAMSVLSKLDVTALSEKESEMMAKLQAKAKKVQSTVDQEPPPEEW